MPKTNFIPKELREQPISSGFTGISHTIYKSAFELLRMAENNKTYYILPSIILFVATIESYFNEILTLNLLMKQYQSQDYLLALRAGGNISFNKKICMIFKSYDKKQKGIDTNSIIYRDFVALVNLRNNIVHYNPDWENIYHFPKHFQHIIKRTNIKLLNCGWTSNFSNIEIGKWAMLTVKNLIVEFSNITGAHNPFTDDERFKSTKWED